jgi:hypothetical protein
MAASVKFASSSYLDSTQWPTWTGDWIMYAWFKIPSAAYGAGDQFAWFFISDDNNGLWVNGTSLSWYVESTGDAQDILTGSDTSWVCISFQHTSGSSQIKLRWRKEKVATWSSFTKTFASHVNFFHAYVNNDQAGEPINNLNARSLYVAATTMDDATLLNATEHLNTASGSPYHWLILNDSATCNTNGGSASNWTKTGSPTTDTIEPIVAAGRPLDFPARSMIRAHLSD